MVVVVVLMLMAVVVDEMDWVVNHASRSSSSFALILYWLSQQMPSCCLLRLSCPVCTWVNLNVVSSCETGFNDSGADRLIPGLHAWP